MKIYPSLISCDILNLEKTILQLDPYCDGYHIDIMDDHFVPNLTWGPAFVNAISKITKLPVHIHLMVDNPTRWVDRLDLDSNDVFIFHYEAMKSKEQIENLIRLIRTKKWNTSLAINPKTNIQEIESYLPLLDQVLVMSVEPGFSGQKFLPQVISKIPSLIANKERYGLSFSIYMDGGISQNNIQMLWELGVEQFAVASAIFSSKNPVLALQNLRKK